MGLSYRSRRGLAAVAYAVLAALAGLMCLRLAVGVEVVKKAAGVPDNAAGVGRFINGAKALVVPMLAMTAAVAPLAIIVGGLSLLFGGRRGLQIMGTALGVLLVLGSVTAIVD
jgi:hypothetical protein